MKVLNDTQSLHFFIAVCYLFVKIIGYHVAWGIFCLSFSTSFPVGDCFLLLRASFNSAIQFLVTSCTYPAFGVGNLYIYVHINIVSHFFLFVYLKVIFLSCSSKTTFFSISCWFSTLPITDWHIFPSQLTILLSMCVCNYKHIRGWSLCTDQVTQT